MERNGLLCDGVWRRCLIDWVLDWLGKNGLVDLFHITNKSVKHRLGHKITLKAPRNQSICKPLKFLLPVNAPSDLPLSLLVRLITLSFADR